MPPPVETKLAPANELDDFEAETGEPEETVSVFDISGMY